MRNKPYLILANSAERIRGIGQIEIRAFSRVSVMCLSFLNFSFQPSPWCFTLCIIFTSTLGNLPKFFEFFLIYDGDESVPDFWTTNLSEDPRYIRSSSYNELIITGIFPLLALCYYNYEIYARIRLSCFIELGRYVGGKYLQLNFRVYQIVDC